MFLDYLYKYPRTCSRRLGTVYECKDFCCLVGLIFQVKVSLYTLGCPGSHSVDKAGLKTQLFLCLPECWDQNKPSTTTNSIHLFAASRKLISPSNRDPYGARMAKVFQRNKPEQKCCCDIQKHRPQPKTHQERQTVTSHD